MDLDNIKLKIGSRVATTPERYRIPMQKALEGTLSPKKCIKMKCLDCVNFEDYTPRIRSCTSYGCPLWHHRPFK